MYLTGLTLTCQAHHGSSFLIHNDKIDSPVGFCTGIPGYLRLAVDMELVRDGPKNKTQARCGYQTSFEGRKRGHIRTNHFKNYKLGKHKPMPNRNPSPKALLRPRWFPSRPTGTSSPNRTGLDVNSVNALLGRKSHSGKCVRTNEINEKW